ncbi:MAG: hypothetical protein H7068_06190 [Pedobacter sp.]|nr:hypothetical protein [Chitinophagaceae bacterium]
MATIEFQNKEFKVREIELSKFGNVLISTNSLNELLLNDYVGYTSGEAKIVGEKIFYFVENNEIELSEEELIKSVTLELK